MKIIVGLGNPEKQYQNTYHNIGFEVAFLFAKKHGIEINKKLKNANYGVAIVNGEKIMVVFPTTYMNLSGKAVIELMQKYKEPKQNFLIVFDDFDLKLGDIRFKASGSGGTHNGIKNIVECVGEDIPRLKIGFFKEENNIKEKADWVLSKISNEDQVILEKSYNKAIERIDEFIKQK